MPNKLNTKEQPPSTHIEATLVNSDTIRVGTSGQMATDPRFVKHLPKGSKYLAGHSSSTQQSLFPDKNYNYNLHSTDTKGNPTTIVTALQQTGKGKPNIFTAHHNGQIASQIAFELQDRYNHPLTPVEISKLTEQQLQDDRLKISFLSIWLKNADLAKIYSDPKYTDSMGGYPQAKNSYIKLFNDPKYGKAIQNMIDNHNRVITLKREKRELDILNHYSQNIPTIKIAGVTTKMTSGDYEYAMAADKRMSDLIAVDPSKLTANQLQLALTQYHKMSARYDMLKAIPTQNRTIKQRLEFYQMDLNFLQLQQHFIDIKTYQQIKQRQTETITLKAFNKSNDESLDLWINKLNSLQMIVSHQTRHDLLLQLDNEASAKQGEIRTLQSKYPHIMNEKGTPSQDHLILANAFDNWSRLFRWINNTAWSSLDSGSNTKLTQIPPLKGYVIKKFKPPKRSQTTNPITTGKKQPTLKNTFQALETQTNNELASDKSLTNYWSQSVNPKNWNSQAIGNIRAANSLVDKISKVDPSKLTLDQLKSHIKDILEAKGRYNMISMSNTNMEAHFFIDSNAKTNIQSYLQKAKAQYEVKERYAESPAGIKSAKLSQTLHSDKPLTNHLTQDTISSQLEQSSEALARKRMGNWADHNTGVSAKTNNQAFVKSVRQEIINNMAKKDDSATYTKSGMFSYLKDLYLLSHTMNTIKGSKVNMKTATITSIKDINYVDGQKDNIRALYNATLLQYNKLYNTNALSTAKAVRTIKSGGGKVKSGTSIGTTPANPQGKPTKAVLPDAFKKVEGDPNFRRYVEGGGTGWQTYTQRFTIAEKKSWINDFLQNTNKPKIIDPPPRRRVPVIPKPKPKPTPTQVETKPTKGIGKAIATGAVAGALGSGAAQVGTKAAAQIGSRVVFGGAETIGRVALVQSGGAVIPTTQAARVGASALTKIGGLGAIGLITGALSAGVNFSEFDRNQKLYGDYKGKSGINALKGFKLRKPYAETYYEGYSLYNNDVSGFNTKTDKQMNATIANIISDMRTSYYVNKGKYPQLDANYNNLLVRALQKQEDLRIKRGYYKNNPKLDKLPPMPAGLSGKYSGADRQYEILSKRYEGWIYNAYQKRHPPKPKPPPTVSAGVTRTVKSKPPTTQPIPSSKPKGEGLGQAVDLPTNQPTKVSDKNGLGSHKRLPMRNNNKLGEKQLKDIDWKYDDPEDKEQLIDPRFIYPFFFEGDRKYYVKPYKLVYNGKFYDKVKMTEEELDKLNFIHNFKGKEIISESIGKRRIYLGGQKGLMGENTRIAGAGLGGLMGYSHSGLARQVIGLMNNVNQRADAVREEENNNIEMARARRNQIQSNVNNLEFQRQGIQEELREIQEAINRAELDVGRPESSVTSISDSVDSILADTDTQLYQRQTPEQSERARLANLRLQRVRTPTTNVLSQFSSPELASLLTARTQLQRLLQQGRLRDMRREQLDAMDRPIRPSPINPYSRVRLRGDLPSNERTPSTPEILRRLDSVTQRINAQGENFGNVVRQIDVVTNQPVSTVPESQPDISDLQTQVGSMDYQSSLESQSDSSVFTTPSNLGRPRDSRNVRARATLRREPEPDVEGQLQELRNQQTELNTRNNVLLGEISDATNRIIDTEQYEREQQEARDRRRGDQRVEQRMGQALDILEGLHGAHTGYEFTRLIQPLIQAGFDYAFPVTVNPTIPDTVDINLQPRKIGMNPPEPDPEPDPDPDPKPDPEPEPEPDPEPKPNRKNLTPDDLIREGLEKDFIRNSLQSAISKTIKVYAIQKQFKEVLYKVEEGLKYLSNPENTDDINEFVNNFNKITGLELPQLIYEEVGVGKDPKTFVIDQRFIKAIIEQISPYVDIVANAQFSKLKFKHRANELRKKIKGSRPLEEGELHYLGANYMGPGTKRQYLNYPPLNKPDAVARQHDIDYYNIFDRYNNYEITDIQRKKLIRQSDNKMINSLEKMGQLEGIDESYRQAGLRGIQFKRHIENVTPSLANMFLPESLVGGDLDLTNIIKEKEIVEAQEERPPLTFSDLPDDLRSMIFGLRRKAMRDDRQKKIYNKVINEVETLYKKSIDGEITLSPYLIELMNKEDKKKRKEKNKYTVIKSNIQDIHNQFVKPPPTGRQTFKTYRKKPLENMKNNNGNAPTTQLRTLIRQTGTVDEIVKAQRTRKILTKNTAFVDPSPAKNYKFNLIK